MATTKKKTKETDEDVLKEILERYIRGGEITAAEKLSIKELLDDHPEYTEAHNTAKTQRSSGTRRSTTSRSGYAGTGSGVGYLPGVSRYLQSRNNNMGGGWRNSNNMVSPGGFKASGRDEDSAYRRSGLLTPENIANTAVKFDNDGGATFGLGRNKRKYSETELQALLSRGLSGATMGTADQMVYDAYMQRRKRIADDIEKNRDAEKQAKDNAEDNLREQRKLDAESDRKLREWKYQQDYEAKLKRDEESRKKAEEDAKYEALNKKHGLPEGARLDDKDYKSLENGTKRYGLSAADQKRLDELDEAWQKDVEDNEGASEDDREQARKRYNERREKIMARQKLVDNDKPRTPEEILAGAYNGLYSDKEGRLQSVPDTFENKQEQARQKAEEARQARQHEREIAREDNLAKERREFMNKFVTAEKKAFGENVMNEGETFDEMASLERARQRWNNIMAGEQSYEPVDEEVDQSQVPILNAEDDMGAAAEESAAAPVASAANFAAKNDLRGFLDAKAAERGLIAKPVPGPDESAAQGEVMPMAEADEGAAQGRCPVCGSMLNGYGICSECGWPDEGAAQQWQSERNAANGFNNQMEE